jgi:hypothetical protein
MNRPSKKRVLVVAAGLTVLGAIAFFAWPRAKPVLPADQGWATWKSAPTYSEPVNAALTELLNDRQRRPDLSPDDAAWMAQAGVGMADAKDGVIVRRWVMAVCTDLFALERVRRDETRAALRALILQRLEDPAPQVRHAAMAAMWSAGLKDDARARSLVEKMIKDPDEDVAIMAERVVKNIRKQAGGR